MAVNVQRIQRISEVSTKAKELVSQIELLSNLDLAAHRPTLKHWNTGDQSISDELLGRIIQAGIRQVASEMERETDLLLASLHDRDME